ncbi:hypothetical protein [Clostridium sp. HMP27]|uniref:hypothetical protein n=1 Tax=Clostridium sp. HMP27 TaxID=1487921 RepID=UPI00052DFF6E|nr:hypothetical protein [Clostridium sp. HMP27]KGK86564.1 hypothetical protein DP68_13225 [Clostridium sp. HMP27]
MDVEIAATSTIEKLISRNSYLKTYIDSNDKTPIWDGNVFVYRNKNCNKKNEDLIGRVPVQVKGREVSKIENNNIKFRIDLESIKKFHTDGGVIFFVVYITQNNDRIYYNSLLPLDLARLIKRYDHQKTLEIELKPTPTEERALADIFLNFVQNRKKQFGTLLPDFLYIEDTENIKNQIKQFKFSYSTVEPNKSTFFKELTTRDIYVYMEPKGIGNPIPIEKISNAIINIQQKFEIALKEKVYYKDAYVQWENGVPSIICGKAIRIIMPNSENPGYCDFNLKIDFKGTLNERIRDLYFLRDMIENKEFCINTQVLQFQHFNLNEEKELYERIDRLNLIKKRLKFYGVKTDLNLDKITEEDYIKLDIITEDCPSIKKYNINLSESHLVKMRIANILIMLMIEEDKRNGCYKIKDFFTSNWRVTYVLNEPTENIELSQFLILDEESLLADNIDAQEIINDIKRYHSRNIDIGYVNMFLLEVIKAYDRNSAQQGQLRYLMKSLSEWLYEESKEDYIFINLAQVKHRLGELRKCDVDKIEAIKETYNDNIEMLVATFILLDKKEEAKHLIDKMNDREKETFISYPIYHLLRNGDIN